MADPGRGSRFDHPWRNALTRVRSPGGGATARARPLVYAVRLPVVGRHLGQLLTLLSVVSAVPLVTALANRAWLAAAAYGGAGIAMLGVGLALARVRAPARVQANEALVVVAAAFLLAPLALVPAFVVEGLTPVDAIFETVSGITTTGLTMLADPSRGSPSLLAARAWLQWVGGLAIVSLSIALITRRGGVIHRLDTVAGDRADFLGGARAHGRRALTMYATLTAAGILILTLLQVDLFDAVLHTLAAVSTGGFSPHRASVAALAPVARGAVMTLCALGALPLVVHHDLARGRWRAALTDPQLLGLLAAALLVTALLLALGGLPDDPLPARAGHAALTALSAQTTAGFATVPPAQLDPASKLVLAVSMLVGGGTGSTAGGVKLLRVLVLLGLTRTLLVRTAMPRHAVARPRIAGQPLEDEEVRDVLLVMILFGVVVLTSWGAFLSVGYPALDSLFEVISATSTTGLSAGLVGAGLEAPLKLALSADMLLGRLEIVALLVLVSPRTWLGKRMETP